MVLLVPYTDICKTAINVKIFNRYKTGNTLITFSFKRKVYTWCLENKIRYKKYKKGFIFENNEDYVALKLRWFSNNE